MDKANVKLLGEFVVLIVAFGILVNNEYKMHNTPEEKTFVFPPLPGRFKKKTVPTPNYDIPLILVAGHPRSGTTLMRSMLDAHGMIRCGEETHIIPAVVGMWDPKYWSNDTISNYEDVGLSLDILKRATANFLLVTIVEHGRNADRFCNKDPLTMFNAGFINKMFPKSKFIFMVRDARATIHSAITRHVSITGFDLKSYEKSLIGWNSFLKEMYTECEKIGKQFCHPVYYEELILRPSEVMKRVLIFLELPWRSEVLRHEEFVDKEKGIKLNPEEPSTDQVSKARYEDALTAWVGKIPHHILSDMDKIAPMLSVLGYDPHANPPLYTKLKYRWAQKLPTSTEKRLPYRRFISAIYHKTNDSFVKEPNIEKTL